jgi:hypothetical protein
MLRQSAALLALALAGDLILRVGELPLTCEAELFAAARSAHDAEHITALVERNGATHLRHFIRTR